MFEPVANRFKTILAPALLAGASLGLSGCFININDVPGVPLDELQMAGAAPIEIALAGPDNVIVTTGETLNITIEGGTNNEELRFDLDGDSLNIGRDGDWLSGSEAATIRVTMPAPRSVVLAGSGNMEVAEIASDSEVNSAGSGSITLLSVDTKELEAVIAGSGSITAAGKTDALNMTIAGSGSARLGDLNAEEVEITIAGSGSVALASDGTVEATIAGSGSINVTGNATCKLESMGSGDLNCKPAETAPAPEKPSDDDTATEE
ncbi:MAG: head GIN domain-containing protein [Pseudomonadota bacterium]|nr:head GIN domain-containing protein [Pseudomonadota bacterium]